MRELKNLEPDGHASRGRAYLLSADSLDATCDDIEVPDEKQSDLQIQSINWTSAVTRRIRGKAHGGTAKNAATNAIIFAPKNVHSVP